MFATFAALIAFIALPSLAETLFAQNNRNNNNQAQAEPARPTPRWPNGKPRLSSLPGEKGLWNPNGRPLLAEPETTALIEGQGRGAFSGPPIPGKPKESEVPFQDWARALYRWREENLFEPHTRCKPSGGPRQFITPGGTEFIDYPDQGAIYIVDVAGPQTYRTIYMDGRGHPDNLAPTYYGHSIGRWEGDTLVVETIGFNERFWIDRQGIPHTEQMKLTERFTRTDYNNMRLDLTFDDPGAYTRTWTTGFWIRYNPGREWDEYICQENNFADRLMVGNQEGLERTSSIVP
jgi:hypothetical protein